MYFCKTWYHVMSWTGFAIKQVTYIITCGTKSVWSWLLIKAMLINIRNALFPHDITHTHPLIEGVKYLVMIFFFFQNSLHLLDQHFILKNYSWSWTCLGPGLQLIPQRFWHLICVIRPSRLKNHGGAFSKAAAKLKIQDGRRQPFWKP